MSTGPHSNQSFSELPPACPQPSGGYTSGSSISEDCLFATVYIPQSANTSSSLPVFVWVHGGSFMEGSASAPGLDGSKLATKGNMIVIVLQYRLGVLGFLAPSSAAAWTDPNLGLRDVILALKGINQGIRFVGGDADKVTIGGQSSGASLIRALWGSPAAKGLFRAAILQSDPMSYGFATQSITARVRDTFFAQQPLASCTTLDCLRAIPVSQIITAQTQLTETVIYSVQGLPISEPIRPTYESVTLPQDPTKQLFDDPSTLTFPPSNLPLLITTVKNEGGSAAQGMFAKPVPIDPNTYYATLAALVGPQRAKSVVSNSHYALPNQTGYGARGDTFRESFDKAVTDGIWKCPNRDVASKWATAGGKVWVGEWEQGATYPGNADDGSYCSTQGRVCHEDDIYTTFGTAPNPSSNTSVLEDNIFTYWSSFINHLDPNPSVGKRDCVPPSSLSQGTTARNIQVEKRGTSNAAWEAYTSEEDVFPLNSSGDGSVDGEGVTTCLEGFWGVESQYDWQLYG
nr:uncharacterized protein CI109_006120 [Kwoniella shandongensis]KAA5525547.1 hypothetical protein CI109_006120 [Kwoniella shandongensis]